MSDAAHPQGAVLREIVERLVAALYLGPIYLFGSRARGGCGSDGNYGLLRLEQHAQTRPTVFPNWPTARCRKFRPPWTWSPGVVETIAQWGEYLTLSVWVFRCQGKSQERSPAEAGEAPAIARQAHEAPLSRLPEEVRR